MNAKLLAVLVFLTLCIMLTAAHNAALEQLTQRTNISYGLRMRIEILPIPVTRPNASSMRNVSLIQLQMLQSSVRLCDIHYGEHSRRLSGETAKWEGDQAASSIRDTDTDRADGKTLLLHILSNHSTTSDSPLY